MATRKIVRTAKIGTTNIAEGQPDIYGFTISTRLNEGEFTTIKNLNIDTDSLSVSEAKVVTDFISLMELKLAI
jgi:hypothetical protein